MLKLNGEKCSDAESIPKHTTIFFYQKCAQGYPKTRQGEHQLEIKFANEMGNSRSLLLG